MRLSVKHQEALIDFFTRQKEHFSPAQLFLFGSRVDDHKKGGDIDLLLLVQKRNFEKITKEKTRLLVEIEELLGDQKVDLLIVSQEDPPTPFQKSLQNKTLLTKI